jgi:pimeloyl-ACP methyl ester carboxylesterase
MRDRQAAAQLQAEQRDEPLEAEPSARTRFHAHGPLPPVAADAAQAEPSASDRAFDGDKRAQMKRDVVAERLAHGIAYHDELTSDDQSYLESKGLKVGKTYHGHGGLDMTTFVPAQGGHATPVLAFRGTQGKADVVDDTNPAGVGAFQMAANEGLIAAALASLQPYGRPIVTGHSLGGALAQMTATRFPDLVGRVVTFQSPGVPRDMVARLDAYNKTAEKTGGRPVESTHYSVAGDIIPLAGQAFTSGFITVISSGKQSLLDELDPFKEHSSYPLEEVVQNDSGYDVRSESERSPSRLSRGLHQFAEALRVGAGRAVELGERLANRGASPTQAYLKVWEEVRASIDAGQGSAHIVTIIQGSSIRAEDKTLMIENLHQITAARAKPAARRP